MDVQQFKQYGYQLIDWIADYYKNIESLPVKAKAAPGDIIKQLPLSAPNQGESFEKIMADFDKIIMPGITHWQHPNFFAYFNANTSFPSILGELLTSALGAQCMSWITSPAATELEERVMEWLREIIGLPVEFSGVIQDTASTATLCSLICARERHSEFRVNQQGLYGNSVYRVYCSSEAHSSIEKAVKIIGFGHENLRKISVDENYAMMPFALENAIKEDLQMGFIPLAVVCALGTTGCAAVDPLEEVSMICQVYQLWLHVDAAYGGTAMVIPEKRHFLKGVELADSFVFNPHKWMFTNFDCSAYFFKDKNLLIRSFEILPEYLKTPEGNRVNNYRDWGIQLGRRFRALKLWFVIRSFGVEGLRKKIGDHLCWAQELAAEIQKTVDFELMAAVHFATVCFRFKPAEIDDTETLNHLNQTLMNQLNDQGCLFLTHTKLNSQFTLRLVIGQTNQTRQHVLAAFENIKHASKKLKRR
jgi:aromatic-L-amino-acid decarboxylase